METALKYIVLLVLAAVFLFVMFVIGMCINDFYEERKMRKMRKKSNLHITVDKDWNKRFKNNK